MAMCRDRAALAPAELSRFEEAAGQITEHFRDEFHGLRQAIKSAYAPLDPDADTRAVALAQTGQDEDLASLLREVLDRGNYDPVTEEALQAAFGSASLFEIRLDVDVDDFEEVLLYTRGATRRSEEVPRLFGLFPRTVSFTNYDRVVLYIRFRDTVDASSTLGGCRPGATMLKLFQNVPDADLEMLFPNTRIGMRTIDKLLIGVPALVSGGVVLTTKLGTTLVLMGSLLGFWLGLHKEEVELNRATVLALLAGLGTLGGYLWKQFSSFRNRKLRFTQALTENLYFKLLDNNAGVLYRLLDDAEDSECKESMIAFYFLLEAAGPVSAPELDARIEAWFAERWACRLDFEIDDALGKLQRLGLATTSEGKWRLKA